MTDLLIHLCIDGLSMYALYGHACLAARHPQNQGEGKQIAVNVIEKIGACLVENGCITAEVRFLHEKGLTQWAKEVH